MKILVLGGAGKIGSAVAWDLVKQDEVERVGLMGRRKTPLERTKEWIGSSKLRLHALGIHDRDGVKDLMKQYDVGVIALPGRRTSYAAVEAAIEAGLDSVDILEEYHRRPEPWETEGLVVPEGMTIEEYGEWLHTRAIENGVTLLDGLGFAPGLSNVTTGEGIRKLDTAETAIARVGGIPAKDAAQRHPLGYMITWAFWHVLREYMVKVQVIKDGQVVEVDAMTDRESFRFTEFGKDEELECAITPGMPSFIYTRPELNEFTEKTIRWPGHWQGIDVLRECGMLDLTPVDFKGVQIRPRDFFSFVIRPKLRPLEGDTDVCVMWNTVTGKKDGQATRIDYYLWDEADTTNNISSMARVTGFAAALGAIFLGRGEIEEQGIVAPEDAIKGKLYERFLEELGKRDIIVRETSATIDEAAKPEA